MHRFKNQFSDLSYTNTEFNIQKCLRLNDLDEIGDSTHYLTFHMLGMFSFRELSVKEAISFWLEFMEYLEIPLTHITLHQDKKSWQSYYPSTTNIVFDENNKWSDGTIGGYCTEFFVNDVEIGNIVNPLGTCIDVGFGLERLLNIKYKLQPESRPEIIKEACESLIYSGVSIDHYKQGYILKKLITELVYSDVVLDHRFYDITKENQKKQYLMYKNESKKNRHKDKPPEYWKNTLGIDINNLSKYESLF